MRHRRIRGQRPRSPLRIVTKWAWILTLCFAAPQILVAQLPEYPDSTRALEISVEDGFTLTSVGDLIISTPLGSIDDPGYTEVVRRLQGPDVTFGNFESTAFANVESFEGHPAALYGGLRVRTPVEVAQNLQEMGFDIVSRANNHTTDWGTEGLRVTSEVLDEAGLVHAGAGETLGAARAGRFLETPKGRVGLVSMASSFTAMAPGMDPLGEVMGRPGLSALRVTPYYFVTEDELEMLREIREAQPEGPAGPAVRVPEDEPEDEVNLFGVRYKVGDRRGWEYEMNSQDLREILRAVESAKRDSDFVVATIHAHEPGNWSDVPPKFLEELARKSIDAGADQFVGHGPHQLRGIEIYKGKPIFYSLANFFFQVELQSPLSRDIYQDFSIDPVEMTDAEFLRRWMKRSFDDPIWYQSVIAESRFEGGEVAEIRLYPVELGYENVGARRGVPRMASESEGEQILRTLQRLSAPYGTDLEIEGGVGIIRIQDTTSTR